MVMISCSENGENNLGIKNQMAIIKVDSSVILESVIKIDTFGVNQFWREQNIQSISLYTYYPEEFISEQRKQEKSKLKRGNNCILDENLELNKYVLNSFTTVLDSFDFEKLKDSVLMETSFSEGVSSCFEPHHGFVLKNDKDKIVGHISVCLACSNYRIYPRESKSIIPMALFRSIIVKNKLPIHRSQVGKFYKKDK